MFLDNKDLGIVFSKPVIRKDDLVKKLCVTDSFFSYDALLSYTLKYKTFNWRGFKVDCLIVEDIKPLKGKETEFKNIDVKIRFITFIDTIFKEDDKVEELRMVKHAYLEDSEFVPIPALSDKEISMFIGEEM